MYSFNDYRLPGWYSYRSEIKSVVIEDGVTSIGSNAFRECSSLTSISIPAAITTISAQAFSYCTSLKSYEIPDSVTAINDGAFSYCTSLESVTFPSGLSTIGNASFEGCTSLKSLDLPSGLNTLGPFAFLGCSSLTSVALPDNVELEKGTAFALCSSLTEFTIGEGNSKYCVDDGILFSKDKKTLVQYQIGKTETEYTIPASVTDISSTAFVGCTNLKSIAVEGSSASFVSEDGVVYSADRSVLVAYPAGKTSSEFKIPSTVTSINSIYCFNGCKDLTKITLSRDIGEIRTLGSAPSLAEVAVSDGSTAYKSIDGVLFSKDGSKLLFCPAAKAGDYTIPGDTTEIGSRAFAYAGKITSITIPDSVTTIDQYAFYGNVVSVDQYGLDSLCGISFGTGLDECDSSDFQYISFFESDGEILIPSYSNLNGNTFSVCGGTLDTGFDIGHDYIAHEATAATSTAAGNTLYYTCKFCDKVFKADKTTETTVLAETVYLVIFKIDDREIETQVQYGAAPAYSGSEPAKPSDERYTYTFKGWSLNGTDVVDLSGETIKENNVTYTALFESSYIIYHIYFRNGDQVLDRESYTYGEMPVYEGPEPTKESTPQCSYKFKGWNKPIVPVTESTTYYAEFDMIINEYEIVFMNGDVPLQMSNVKYGETPVYTKDTPTKASDAQYSYTFIGWDKPIVPVTGPMIYYAVFDSVVNEYEVLFMNGDVPLQMSNVKYGVVPVYTKATPTKASDDKYTYKFTGWDKPIVAVTGPVTYNAVFEAVPISNDDSDSSSIIFAIVIVEILALIAVAALKFNRG